MTNLLLIGHLENSRFGVCQLLDLQIVFRVTHVLPRKPVSAVWSARPKERFQWKEWERPDDTLVFEIPAHAY